MKKLLIIFFTIAASAAMAQSSYTSLEYSVGFAAGDLGTYVAPASFRGFTLDYRKFVNHNVGVGFEFGWNVFYEELPYDTYNRGTLSYSGKQYRYSNEFPMLIGVDYFMKPGEMVNPYAGLGLGTMYSLRATDMGTWRLEQDAWHFALRPEIGLIFEVSDYLGFQVAAKYYHGFAAGDLDTQGYFGLNFGFVFKTL